MTLRNSSEEMETVSFDEILNFTLENSVMSMSKGFTVLQQYLNVMCQFKAAKTAVEEEELKTAVMGPENVQ